MKKYEDKEIKLLLSSGMVKAVLSYPKYNTADILLLNDGETYIKLSEQDYYSYHDCSSSARHIEVMKSKENWELYLKEYVPAKSLT